MKENQPEDRLKTIERLLEQKKRQRNQLCWLRYNASSQFKYDVENAEEDVAWMIFEIKRLREENQNYKEFIDSLRRQMEGELGIGNSPE
jgi:alanyl-tRNA synthetase